MIISSYRLGDLVILNLSEKEQEELLLERPDSMGSKYVMEKRKNPEINNNLEIITNIVLSEMDKYKDVLPKDIENSTVIHLRLGDVLCGDKWYEKAKRPFDVEHIENLLSNVTDKKYVIGKCFFGTPAPSPNFEESIIASNKYLSEVLERMNAEHFDGGSADIDLCCAIKCKLFVQGRGLFSRLMVIIREKLGLPSIECECVDQSIHF
jgi:hypothetical protein